jgi:NADPH2:quinone reductase
MKAVVLREPGAPEQLELTELPDPEPGDGQVLLRVRAAGVNFADVLVRQGRYPQAPPLPTVLGHEVAGEVDGRRVMTASGSEAGGYSELTTVDEEWLVPLPDSASFEEGASFLTTFLTAYIPLTRLTRVEPGTTVLVHAAAGGVGSASVQLAKQLGANVVATASSDQKRRVALDLGADEAYSYDEFPERVKADVVLDAVGGDVFKRSIGVLNPLGVIVGIGFAGGWWDPLDTALMVGRNLALQGFYLGRLMKLRPDLVREATGELIELWERGAVKPLVGARFPLDQAPEAHRLIEERKSVGKVVLVP